MDCVRVSHLLNTCILIIDYTLQHFFIKHTCSCERSAIESFCDLLVQRVHYIILLAKQPIGAYKTSKYISLKAVCYLSAALIVTHIGNNTFHNMINT